jgi:hypothetical protein
MTTDYGEGVVRRFWEEIFGQGDIKAIDEIFAADYKLHDLVYRERHSIKGLKRIVRETNYAVPGIRFIVDDQRLTWDDRVFTRFRVRVPAPQDAQQATLPGDGWKYSGMSISRVVEGKIEESWLVWEALRAAVELGPVFGPGDWRWPPWR